MLKASTSVKGDTQDILQHKRTNSNNLREIETLIKFLCHIYWGDFYFLLSVCIPGRPSTLKGKTLHSKEQISFRVVAYLQGRQKVSKKLRRL